MAAQLPRDFEHLLEPADMGRRRAAPREDIVGRVAELEGTEPREAERHAHAASRPCARRSAARRSPTTAQLSHDYASLLVSRHHDEEGHHDDR